VRARTESGSADGASSIEPSTLMVARRPMLCSNQRDRPACGSGSRGAQTHGGAIAFAHMQQRLERLARARPCVERQAERRGDGDSRRSDQRRQLAWTRQTHAAACRLL
jgi:hypothetical protein